MTIFDGFSFGLGRWLADIAVAAVPYAIIFVGLIVLVLIERSNK